jgi:RimJ/RimL family protein N-acetyltransferase
MIRAARFQDVTVIAEMLREMHVASKYFGRVGISEKVMDQMLMAMIAQQPQMGPQGTYVAIAERGGHPVGFMIGVLDRVYQIGDRLVANDVFLHVREGGGAGASIALIRGYIKWASAIRTVVEIKLSWVNTLPGAGRVAAIYEKCGFERAGEIFERRADGGKS